MLIADGRCRIEVSPQWSKGLILEDLGVEYRMEANPVAVFITRESLMLLLENSKVFVCIGTGMLCSRLQEGVVEAAPGELVFHTCSACLKRV